MRCPRAPPDVESWSVLRDSLACGAEHGAMTTGQPTASAPLPRRPRPWRHLGLSGALIALLVSGLCAGVLTAILLGSSPAPRSPGSLVSGPAPSPGLPGTSMLSVGALERLEQAGPPRHLLSSFFDKPTTILIGAAGPGGDRIASRASAAADFTSATALIQALQAGRVPASVPDVVLDLEAWPLTPVAEQHAPIAAAAEAARAAQAAGKRLIFTPGVDLVRVLTGQRLHASALGAAYDRLLAGPGAAVSDVFEIQAQGTEGTAEVPSFVDAALQAARAAHRGIPLLVGLSTNPSGRRVTPQDLLQLAQAAQRAGASGFWLNVPEAGRACPRCGTAQPQVALSFLEQLARAASPSTSHPVTPSAPGIGTAPPAGLLDAAGHLLAAGGRPAGGILAASQRAVVVGQPGLTRLMGGGTVYELVSARHRPSRCPGDLHPGGRRRGPLGTAGRSAPGPRKHPGGPLRQRARRGHPGDRAARPLGLRPAGGPARGRRAPVAICDLIEVTASELAADIGATHDLVQGCWLNVPAPGVGCPACGPPDLGLMASALEQLAR